MSSGSNDLKSLEGSLVRIIVSIVRDMKNYWFKCSVPTFGEYCLKNASP